MLPRTGDNIHAHHRLAVSALLQPGLVANSQLALGLFGLLQHARRMLLFLGSKAGAGAKFLESLSSWYTCILGSTLDRCLAFPFALRYFTIQLTFRGWRSWSTESYYDSCGLGYGRPVPVKKRSASLTKLARHTCCMLPLPEKSTLTPECSTFVTLARILACELRLTYDPGILAYEWPCRTTSNSPAAHHLSPTQAGLALLLLHVPPHKNFSIPFHR